MINQIRIAIIGVGNMGGAHAQCISSGQINGLTLTAVCDIQQSRLHWCAERFPQAQRFGGWRELLASGTADAILIATPHPLHAEIAAAALRKGLHVLSEKPADISVLRAREAVRAAEETGKTYAVMLNQRTNPLFRKAREMVQAGEMGQLKRSVWIITNWYRTQAYYDSSAWRATWAGEGGGVLLNQAPHNLDLWQWICGMPASIRAQCDVARYHRIAVEDDATLFARYENGATGLFVTSTGEYPGTNRLEISGTKGKLVLENGAMKLWRLARDEAEVRFSAAESLARVPVTEEEIIPEGTETAHRGILQNFADHILRGEPLIAPGADGLRELVISNAAYLSAWSDSAEIPIPFDEARFDALLRAKAEAEDRPVGQDSHAIDGEYSERWQVRW